MNPSNPGHPPLNSGDVALIELAPGVHVTQEFLDELPKNQIQPFIDGYTDMLEGRVVPHEEVLNILEADAKQNCLESKSTSSI
jgi:hypothetical protein